MKIEINEQPSNEPLFPAFYKDRDGGLWFWINHHAGVEFEAGGAIHIENDYESVSFNHFKEDYGLTRVHGTITITV